MEQVHVDGFAIVDLLSADKVEALRAFYAAQHNLASENGGLFYSVYSNDLDYRKRVHEHIGALIRPELDAHLTDYKNVLNSFVIKASGPKSAFYVHQDTTALDEYKHSALSIWIALQDTGPENGGMNIIPRTHWLLSPYRGVTIPFPFKNIQEAVRSFLQPVRLKAGQALVFDPRIIHDSSVNSSGEDRVAIVSGIFPKEAEFITCYKDQSNPENPIELHSHSDNYLIEYPKFFYDCHDRPETSKMLGTVPDDFPELSADRFESFCLENGLAPDSKTIAPAADAYEFISEPIQEASLDVQKPKKGWLRFLSRWA